MDLKINEIDCQNPATHFNIRRIHTVVDCSIARNTDEYKSYLQKAQKLAQDVNPGAANASAMQRPPEVILRDAMAGVLAEQGWLAYINSTYGQIAEPTEFIQANGQIDIALNNGNRIEVRSSFVRNGVKFGVCNEKYNFKVIGNYSNLYKPGEIQKDYYVLVLFATPKPEILTAPHINFSLIGGVTDEILKAHGFESDMVAEDDITQTRTKYKVLRIADAGDIKDFDTWLQSVGYPKQ